LPIKTSKFSYRVTHPLAVAVVEGLELDDIWMSNNAHDLKFSVLQTVSLRMLRVVERIKTHLETLVLKHTLDGCIFSAWRQLGMEDNTEGSIADDLTLCIGEFSRLSSQAILDLLADDFCKNVSK
jgi:hypothetical protein